MSKRNYAIVALALWGCGDDLAPPESSPPALRDVVGSSSFVNFDEAGQRSATPVDMTGIPISVQVPDGEGWRVVDTLGTAAGTFSIPGVPLGDYWIEVPDAITGERQLLWTNASRLELDVEGVGRGDAVHAAPGTRLTLGPIDGLDPAQLGDGLEITSANAGLVVTAARAFQTDATRFETSFAWTNKPLLSSARGDRLILAQLRASVDATTSTPYRSLTKAATFDAIEQRDREETRVTGTLVTPPALAYDLQWDRVAFVAASAAIHPGRVGEVAGQAFAVRAMPGGTEHGGSSDAPLVLSVNEPTDLHLAITNPYPESWLFQEVALTFGVTLAVPGGGSLEVGAAMRAQTDALGPVQPLVTPPQAPLVEGADLFVDRDGVGLTPTISWSVPAHGTATAYVIAVERWERGVPAPLATLIVPGDVTSVRMPARLLEAGQHYLLRIAAVAQRDQDVRVHSLYAKRLPFGSAELVTSTLSP